MTGGALTYIGVFVGSALLSVLVTPLAVKLAVSRGLFDQPGGHKSHRSPVPYLGGLAIVFSFAAALAVATLLNPPVGGPRELMLILGLGAALSVIGLVDDIRGLGPAIRLIAEVGAAVALWRFGEGVEVFGSELIDGALTIAWVVGITNAFNLLDNMDGLSAGVASIAAGWFFVIAAANGQFLVAGLAVALAGCALGFLRHNFHPARIYMGDAGSLFLGFLLAALGIKLRFAGPAEVTFLVPILVLGVPIFDTTLVTITRLLHRRSPMQGGRDHVSHRLVFVGVPVRAAVGLIYGSAVAVGWIGLVVSRIDRPSAYLLAGLVLVLAGFIGIMLGSVPVYDTSRRRRMMILEVAPHEEPGGPAVGNGTSPPVNEEDESNIGDPASRLGESQPSRSGSSASS